MIKFHKETEQEKIYKEMVNELSQVKLLDRSYKLGVASVMASLHKWCDDIKNEGLDEITPEQIKKAFVDWISYDVELNTLFSRLMNAEDK